MPVLLNIVLSKEIAGFLRSLTLSANRTPPVMLPLISTSTPFTYMLPNPVISPEVIPAPPIPAVVNGSPQPSR